MISIDAEKAFDKIHHFMVRNSSFLARVLMQEKEKTFKLERYM